MVGFRKEEFYINKYGENLGKEKYKKVVSNRNSRILRRTILFSKNKESVENGDAVECLVCGNIFKRITRTHLKQHSMSPIDYKNMYPSSNIVAKNLKKLFSNTKDSIIEKYGEQIGLEKWNEYCDIQAKTNTFEYKSEKYNISKNDFDLYNKSRSCTLDNFIKRFGNEEGNEKWKEYCNRQRYTKSLEYFIDKFGIEKGIEEYKHICELKTIGRQNSNISDPIFISNLLDISIDDAISFISANANLLIASKIELEFVRSLEKIIGDIEYSNLSEPFYLWSENNKLYIYDIKHKNCIVEFNGDYWHANPNRYKSTDLIKGISSEAIWEKDKIKNELAISKGYNLMVVWESEYTSNKNLTLERVSKWILNTVK